MWGELFLLTAGLAGIWLALIKVAPDRFCPYCRFKARRNKP